MPYPQQNYSLAELQGAQSYFQLSIRANPRDPRHPCSIKNSLRFPRPQRLTLKISPCALCLCGFIQAFPACPSLRANEVSDAISSPQQ